MGFNKEWKRLVGEAQVAGGRVETKKKGIMIYGPTGLVMLHTSTSDHRALANTRSELRKAGLDV